MNQSSIRIGDREFKPYLSEEKILAAIAQIAAKINQDFAGKTPLFIPILNGSFLFAADLFKQLTIECEISFVKVQSYTNTKSSGKLTELIGLNESIENRSVIILEDIVDTGNTLAKILPEFERLNPNSIAIATLLFKPNALKQKLKIDYVGLEIPNDFIVGYGLDYNGLGRNLKDIYQVV